MKSSKHIFQRNYNKNWDETLPKKKHNNKIKLKMAAPLKTKYHRQLSVKKI